MPMALLVFLLWRTYLVQFFSVFVFFALTQYLLLRLHILFRWGDIHGRFHLVVSLFCGICWFAALMIVFLNLAHSSSISPSSYLVLSTISLQDCCMFCLREGISPLANWYTHRSGLLKRMAIFLLWRAPYLYVVLLVLLYLYIICHYTETIN